MFAEVVVNAPLSRRRVPYAERTEGFASPAQTFTYAIPAPLAAQLRVGHLVTVPFGARKLQGIVVDFSQTTALPRVKELYEIADPVPVLSAAQVALAQWMCAYYVAPLIACILQMFPPGLESEVQTRVAPAPGAPAELPAGADEAQRALWATLQDAGALPLDDLLGRAPKPAALRALDMLVRRAFATRETVLLPPRAHAASERTLRLVAEPTPDVLASVRSERQKEVLQYLIARGGLAAISTVRELREATRADPATLAALQRANLIHLESREVVRDPLKGFRFERSEPPPLTADQQAVWEQIEPVLGAPVAAGSALPSRSSGYELDPAAAPEPDAPTFLLWGVTGSGKTEIYLHAVAATLAAGRQAIVLVPEIALTPQTIRRFAERFPGRVMVAHSQLGAGERYDQWRRMRAGEVDVVVGTRSAVFAPLPRLGLLVLDEEHEGSYKQDKTPSYHARDVARRYAALAGAAVVLGSATPSLESMYRARRGAYRLLHLPHRIETRLQGDGPHAVAARARPLIVDLDLPPVEIVDMRAELKAGNTSIFSRALRDALSETLAVHEQAILFLNRRGAATFVMCRDCGFVLKCRRCDSPVTYHADQADLLCHHCGRRYAMPSQCPSCGGKRIRQFGAGTQKVEELVRRFFPTARLMRWDRDVTGARGAHDALLRRFAAHEADVLVGTQMIAKGLDLPLVTLVGVVSADTALNLPDFRAGERTFQLLTQVAGRAGRSRLLGRAIFQTYAPAHPAIVAAARHDYAEFYEAELAFRARLDYPPCSKLIRLLFLHPSEPRARESAESLHRALDDRLRQLGLPGTELIGPAPCFYHKVRGQFRWQVIVKGEDPHRLLSGFVLPVGWRVDADPMTVL